MSPPFHKIFSAYRQLRFSKNITRHVSTVNLQNLDTSTLLNMQKTDHSDQKTGKEGYNEEYYGLQYLPIWTNISEQEYSKIKHIVGHTLSAMAISTVKYDENGKLKRAK